jgi:hypothetical protein
MNYELFLEKLKENQWGVPNKSFAHKAFGEWQVAFIRMGGRYQQAGTVAFVVCIRHTNMRNLDAQHLEIDKEPHSYPFKFTLEDITKENFQYQTKLLNYDMSLLPTDDGWSKLYEGMEQKIPSWLSTLTRKKLGHQINKFGNSGYIEKIWLEDLA